MSSKGDAPEDSQGGIYRFVTIESPSGLQDAHSRKLSRTHAVRYALQNREKRRSCDFRIVTARDIAEVDRTRLKRRPAAPETSNVIASQTSVSIFSTQSSTLLLSTDAERNNRRLQVLLVSESAKDAGMPVFSINPAVSYQSFSRVFSCDLQDQAIINALLYCLTFSLDGRANAECLKYKHKAIRALNERLSEQQMKTISPEATIKAILLLVGVESRLGLRSQVQLHMNGVARLVEICRSQRLVLSDGIKRSIFWRDLDSALLTGSQRLFCHESFQELYWQRNPTHCQYHLLPEGFACRRHLFTKPFLEVVEDIHAMESMSCSVELDGSDCSVLSRLDNQQAWQESRIYSMILQLPRNDPWLHCCHWAAYICSYVMFTSIWESKMIPSYCSTQLLRHLQADSDWTGHEDLLTWLLFIGAACAPPGLMTAQYASLITGDYAEKIVPFTESWAELEECLAKFIWPRLALQSFCRATWEETCLYGLI